MPQHDYKVRSLARIPSVGGDVLLVTDAELEALAARVNADAWEHFANVVAPALERDLRDQLQRDGLLVTAEQRDQLVQDAIARTVRELQPTVQDIRIVGLPPMNAEVIRDERGRIAGVIDG